MEERLKQLRAYFGLSQVKFAQRIHKTPSYISNAETGRCHISEECCLKISQEFGIHYRWLIAGEGEMFLSEHVPAPVDEKNVRQRIKQIRKSAKLTQEQFAYTIGYSKMQICLIETGKSKPSDVFVQKVAVTYGISPEWIRTGTGVMEEVTKDDVDDKLIQWLRSHPEVVKDLKHKYGLE